MEGSNSRTPEPNSTPKLSLFSLPTQQPEPPGMLTPPLQPQSSIPFLWEEAPGKPRNLSTTTTNTSVARCLELPPRLLSSDAKMTEIPSPTEVLDGPYIVRRSSSHSTLFTREKLISFEEVGSVSKRRSGIWGRRTCKRNTRVCEDSCVISPSSSSSTTTCSGDSSGGVHTKVKITRIRRVGSFFTHSKSHSRIWTSIFGSFKQVVPLPWKSRKMKEDGSL